MNRLACILHNSLTWKCGGNSLDRMRSLLHSQWMKSPHDEPFHHWNQSILALPYSSLYRTSFHSPWSGEAEWSDEDHASFHGTAAKRWNYGNNKNIEKFKIKTYMIPACETRRASTVWGACNFHVVAIWNTITFVISTLFHICWNCSIPGWNSFRSTHKCPIFQVFSPSTHLHASQPPRWSSNLPSFYPPYNTIDDSMTLHGTSCNQDN